MKILLLVHHFPPRYSAGAELYTYRLARWLLAHRHQVEVVCIEALDASVLASLRAERDVYEGVPVWRLHLGLRGAPSNWSYANPMVAEWVARYMRTERPDLLHLHSGYLLGAGVLAAAHVLDIPSVVTLHDYWFLCPRITLLRSDGSLCATPPENPAACAWCQQAASRSYRLPNAVSGGLVSNLYQAVHQNGRAVAERRAFLQQAIRLACAVIAPSQFLAGYFADVVAPARLYVLPIGLDTAALRALPPALADGPLRLAYIGQISVHKGVHVLVEAVRRLPDGGRPVALTIHGNLAADPAYVRRLRATIGEDRRITLAGPFVNQQIGAVLGPAHAVVVPSIWYENSPLSILEAQAAGRPVLASAMGGMAELVRDEVDGLHFLPGDAGDLARQIQRLRDEPALLERLEAGIRPPPGIDDEMAVLMSIYEGAASRDTALITKVA